MPPSRPSTNSLAWATSRARRLRPSSMAGSEKLTLESTVPENRKDFCGA